MLASKVQILLEIWTEVHVLPIQNCKILLGSCSSCWQIWSLYDLTVLTCSKMAVDNAQIHLHCLCRVDNALIHLQCLCRVDWYVLKEHNARKISKLRCCQPGSASFSASEFRRASCIFLKSSVPLFWPSFGPRVSVPTKCFSEVWTGDHPTSFGHISWSLCWWPPSSDVMFFFRCFEGIVFVHRWQTVSLINALKTVAVVINLAMLFLVMLYWQ